MDEQVIITPDAWARIAAAVLWVEQQPKGGLELDADPVFAAVAPVHQARVTSVTLVSGRYPAVLLNFKASVVPDGVTEWSDGDAIWLVPANGETLALGVRYPVRGQDFANGRFAYTLAGTPSPTPGLPSLATLTMGAQVTLAGAAQTYNGFGSLTVVSFDTTVFDTGPFYSFGSHPTRLTVANTGYYYVSALAPIAYTGALAANGMVHLIILVNGATQYHVASLPCPQNTGPNPNMQSMILNFAGLMFLTSGDYIEMQIANFTVNNFGSGANGTQMSFSILQVASP